MAATGADSRTPSVFLFSVDDTDVSQRVFQWFLKTVYHNGDEVHIINVIPRSKFQASAYAVPAVDYVPQIDRAKYEAAIANTEEFIVRRYLSVFPLDSKSTPIVHIVKSEIDTETVGHIIVQKAEELKATMIVMANRSKGAVTEFFMGSVSKYVLAHSKKPVLVAKGI